MEGKMDKIEKIDVVEMLSNLQTDANNIILQQAVNNLTKLDETAADVINRIQLEINKTFKDYFNYIVNK